MGVHSVRRPISAALGFTDFAMNYFELKPGESVSGGYHTHHDQEEVFYVEDGTAQFDTEDGAVTVDSGEVIRFAPGKFQQEYNPEDADEQVVGFAFGSPGAQHEWVQIESLVHCRICEATSSRLRMGAFELTCTDCENSFVLG
ncbi:cupin [Natrialba chahannaoensis JCM 10990]|uniref:Cupin n=2 Tax=Natrialba chahannaoensis TaxID=68911 RepID=M0ARI7_9EURY|nr:cupin [Natrialba chahannaoensis JCM 10990]